jgi:multiple sugar transport system permease protein
MSELVGRVADPHTVLTGSSPTADHSEGMSYLETLPRRLVSLYLPLGTILLVLLFPFYWIRPSSTSTSSCSRATIRGGCGTR